MTVIKQIEDALKAGPTEGDWSVPHYSRDDVDCDCTSVLSESYCGAIATIHFNDGKPISEGGGDDPIPSEAKANGLLIAACNPAKMREVLAHIKVQDAEIARLRKALQMLHDDVADYQRINKLVGYDNHCMKLARVTLATTPKGAA